MAEAVHLHLKANGADIKGESSQHSEGRKDSIECVYYGHAAKTAREAWVGHGVGSSSVRAAPQAHRQVLAAPRQGARREPGHRSDLQVFRPNPTGGGTAEQLYTVHIKQGRFAEADRPRYHHPGDLDRAPLEEVTFVFHTISWTYTNGGVTHEDNCGSKPLIAD